MVSSKLPKVLIYDIETPLNVAYLFALGKQSINHTQLMPGFSSWGIICITYCWNDGSPVKCIRWNATTGTKGVIEAFDKIIAQADLTIGKNSQRFDTKMINAQRMLAGLPGMPEWTKYTDDLEVQMRRYFRLPSQSLDYISGQLGLGGKIKMEFNDWIAIHQWMHLSGIIEKTRQDPVYTDRPKILDYFCELTYRKTLKAVIKAGKIAMDKMCKYGMKDTEDTRTLWNKLSEHFDPRFNTSAFINDNNMHCKHSDCGSRNIVKNGKNRVGGKTRYQRYMCSDCGREAGRAPISDVLNKVGKIG